MRRIILSLAILAMMMNSSCAQQVKTSDLFDRLIYSSKGATLPYRLLKPVNPGAMERYPLVIFLHGAGERGSDNEVHIQHISDLFLDERNRGKYPCYLIAPQCPKGQYWADFDRSEAGGGKLSAEPSKMTELVTELIEKISKEYPIDATRIYITGVSMGGYGTWDLIARHPNKFAAAVPICGGGDATTASAIKNIPLWIFHGAKDDVVSVQESRRMLRALWEVGASPGYTEYPDIAHDSWTNAYKEPHLIHWMFAQQLGKSN